MDKDSSNCLICFNHVGENEGIDIECGCNPVKPIMHHECYKKWEKTLSEKGELPSCPHCREVPKIINHNIYSISVETGTISLSIEHPFSFRKKMFTPGTRSKLLKNGNRLYDFGMYKLEITDTKLQMYLVNTMVLRPLCVNLDLIYKLQLVSQPGQFDVLRIYSTSFKNRSVLSTIKGSNKTKSLFDYLNKLLNLEDTETIDTDLSFDV
jgi:hypothetical protein